MTKEHNPLVSEILKQILELSDILGEHFIAGAIAALLGVYIEGDEETIDKVTEFLKELCYEKLDKGSRIPQATAERLCDPSSEKCTECPLSSVCGGNQK